MDKQQLARKFQQDLLKQKKQAITPQNLTEYIEELIRVSENIGKLKDLCDLMEEMESVEKYNKQLKEHELSREQLKKDILQPNHQKSIHKHHFNITDSKKHPQPFIL